MAIMTLICHCIVRVRANFMNGLQARLGKQDLWVEEGILG